jgi:hypothetical protein
MAKIKKTKSRPGIPHPARRYASPEKKYSPDATSGPGPLVDTIYSAMPSIPEGTNLPYLDPGSGGSEILARNKWEALDKYFLRKLFLPVLLTMVICGGIFIQDNGAGKLEDWKSISWTLMKCGVVTALYLSLLIIQWIFQKITKR